MHVPAIANMGTELSKTVQQELACIPCFVYQWSIKTVSSLVIVAFH